NQDRLKQHNEHAGQNDKTQQDQRKSAQPIEIAAFLQIDEPHQPHDETNRQKKYKREIVLWKRKPLETPRATLGPTAWPYVEKKFDESAHGGFPLPFASDIKGQECLDHQKTEEGCRKHAPDFAAWRRGHQQPRMVRDKRRRQVAEIGLQL